ncbi:transposase [Streptomyces sp. CL12-4]|nr:transposase [Streptomyces sp. CL12-4]
MTDAQWARIEPLLPDRTPQRGGRWRDHRQVIDAIAFRFQTGTQWVHLPEKYGNWRGVYNRLRMWAVDGASAAQAAQARHRVSSAVPVFIDTREVTISPLANLDVPSLIPGWALDVASVGTCRQVAARLKIVGLRVQETGGDESNPGAESVQVQVAATAAEAA